MHSIRTTKNWSRKSLFGGSQQRVQGTNRYFYLEGIRLSESKSPVGVLEIEQKTASGIKRIRKLVDKGTDLFVASGELDQYKGFTVVDIDARGVEGFGEGYVEFTNGERLTAGTTSGDTTEDTLHRLQIRESIKAWRSACKSDPLREIDRRVNRTHRIGP